MSAPRMWVDPQFQKGVTPPTSSKEWATLNAPDGQSAGYASVVQAQLEMGKMLPQVYLMRLNGCSRAQADETVKACGPSSKWTQIKRFVLNLLS